MIYNFCHYLTSKLCSIICKNWHPEIFDVLNFSYVREMLFNSVYFILNIFLNTCHTQ